MINARTSLRLIGCTLLVGASTATAQVERYKIEAEFRARIAELEKGQIIEGFESAAWDGARSPTINDRSSLPSVESQGLVWEAAAKSLWGSQFSSRTHGLTTNHNWARTGAWGLYEDHVGEPYPTTIRVSSSTPMYAIGAWVDTNPDGQDVGYLFEDRTTANAPGYVLAGFGAMYPGDNAGTGHTFNGLVDPDGFTSVILTGTLEVNEEAQLEGGTIYGVDDFLIVVDTVPLCETDGDPAQIDVTDLLTYLALWFALDPAADIDGGGVEVTDLLTFLSCWFPASAG